MPNVSRHLSRPALTLGLAWLVACSPAGTPPTAPQALQLPAAVHALAVTVDVATGTSVSSASRHASAASPAAALGAPTSYASLLGVDGVAVEVGRVERGLLGGHAPGKVRVFVKLRLRNALDRTRLLTPTFPAPPAGAGLYLFAVQSVAVDTAGGVSVAGNTIRVEAPSRGTVIPNGEWDGAPFDYIRGAFAPCGAGSSTCARWRRFDAPLGPSATSEWRIVSYDIDPTVHHMRLRFVVAADLANAT